jgi:hypothetical protein
MAARNVQMIINCDKANMGKETVVQYYILFWDSLGEIMQSYYNLSNIGW